MGSDPLTMGTACDWQLHGQAVGRVECRPAAWHCGMMADIYGPIDPATGRNKLSDVTMPQRPACLAPNAAIHRASAAISMALRRDQSKAASAPPRVVSVATPRVHRCSQVFINHAPDSSPPFLRVARIQQPWSSCTGSRQSSRKVAAVRVNLKRVGFGSPAAACRRQGSDTCASRWHCQITAPTDSPSPSQMRPVRVHSTSGTMVFTASP